MRAPAAGGAGSGRCEPCAFRYRIRSARSCGLLIPAKVILVPGAKALGDFSHSLIFSHVQVPPLDFSASE